MLLTFHFCHSHEMKSLRYYPLSPYPAHLLTFYDRLSLPATTTRQSASRFRACLKTSSLLHQKDSKFRRRPADGPHRFLAWVALHCVAKAPQREATGRRKGTRRPKTLASFPLGSMTWSELCLVGLEA